MYQMRTKPHKAQAILKTHKAQKIHKAHKVHKALKILAKTRLKLSLTNKVAKQLTKTLAAKTLANKQ